MREGSRVTMQSSTVGVEVFSRPSRMAPASFSGSLDSDAVAAEAARDRRVVHLDEIRRLVVAGAVDGVLERLHVA